MKKNEKLNIWLSCYQQGEATLYCDNAEGQILSKAVIEERYNYSVQQLQHLLNLPRRICSLIGITHEIYEHNKSLYERNKRDCARYWGGVLGRRLAERAFPPYPQYKNRLKINKRYE